MLSEYRENNDKNMLIPRQMSLFCLHRNNCHIVVHVTYQWMNMLYVIKLGTLDDAELVQSLLALNSRMFSFYNRV